jgi:hypothetical protein
MRQITFIVFALDRSRLPGGLEIGLLRSTAHANGFFQPSVRLRKRIPMPGIRRITTMLAKFQGRPLQRSFAF